MECKFLPSFKNPALKCGRRKRETKMDRITKEMTVEEVLERYSDTVKVFMDLSIPCLVCGEPLWGTIEETAQRYNVKLDVLLEELNKVLNNKHK